MSELIFITNIADLRVTIRDQRHKGKRIGLVPTMGNLHRGHLKLIEVARQQCDWVICSIFVNPMQFGPDEDLAAYPRTLEQDKNGLRETGCHCLFLPDVEEVYPEGLQAQTVVSVPELGANHCGKSRPGHFDGVTTVVCKLFNLCQPDIAFFGLKDYQQFLIIKKMVLDLQLPVSMAGIETVRECDGLAISSRNNYLSSEQRQMAPALHQALQDISQEISSGNRDFQQLEMLGNNQLREAGMQPDYFAICNAKTLRPAIHSDSSIAILAAAYLGKARLIDNVRLSLTSK